MKKNKILSKSTELSEIEFEIREKKDQITVLESTLLQKQQKINEMKRKLSTIMLQIQKCEKNIDNNIIEKSLTSPKKSLSQSKMKEIKEDDSDESNDESNNESNNESNDEINNESDIDH